MAKDCWCDLKIHLPGEKKRHEKACEKARRLLGLAEEAEKRWKK